jgi:hypothetical protein
MANALTAVKEITLLVHNERFASAGLKTLAFDYRHWGRSGGSPRNQIVPYDLLQDIRNATTWLDEQPLVDFARIMGWRVFTTPITEGFQRSRRDTIRIICSGRTRTSFPDITSDLTGERSVR